MHETGYIYIAFRSTWSYTTMLGLWCLTPLSTLFELYYGGQFYWWRKPEHWPAADKRLSQNIVSSTLRMGGIKAHTGFYILLFNWY